MAVLKKLFRFSLWFGAGVMALALIALAILQTSPGRSMLEGTIASLASSPEQTIELDGLQIGWGLDVRLDRATLSDASGAWLQLNNLDLDWSPTALFGAALDIERLSAETITVLRKPVASDPETAEPTQSSSLPAIEARLGAVAIEALELGPDILGSPIRLRLTGSAEVRETPRLMRAELDIWRDDDQAGEIHAALEFASDADKLQVLVDVAEPRGGLIARLLEIDALPALDVSLNGSGPLTDWAADLNVALDGRAAVRGTATLVSIDAGRELAANLKGDLAPLAPPIAAAFLLGETSLVASARLDSAWVPAAGKIKLQTQTLRLSAAGAHDAATGAVDGHFDLEAGAGGNTLIALDLTDRRVTFGALTAKATATGALDDLSWNLAINGTSLGTTEGALPDLTLKASGAGGRVTGDKNTLPFETALSIKEFQPADQRLARFAGPVDLATSGEADLGAGTVSFGTTALEGAGLTLKLASASVSARNVKADGTLTAADLSRYSALSGQDLGGSLAAAFDLSADLTAQSGSGKVLVNGTNLKSGIAQADALLAGRSRLELEGSGSSAGEFAISQLKATAAGLDIAGSGSLEAGVVSANLTASLRGLNRIDQRVAGALDLALSASGPPTEPEFDIKLASKELRLEGTPISDLTVTAKGIASRDMPSGSVNAEGRMNGAPLSASAMLSSDDLRVALNGLEVLAGGNRITGSARAGSLQSLPHDLEASFNINAPSLDTLSPLLLTEIAGRLDGNIDLEADQLAISASAQDLSIPGFNLASADADMQIATPFAVPQATGTLQLSGLRSGATPVDRVSLEAKSDGTNTDFVLDARLEPGENGDGIATKGRLSAVPNGFDLVLASLDGQYSGLETRLADQAMLTYRGRRLTVSTLSLALGSGRLSLAGTMDKALDFRADISAVPVALANAFAPGLGLVGTVSGSVFVHGTPASPIAEWNVSGSGLSAAVLQEAGLPALGLSGTGRFENNRVTQETTATGPENMAVSGRGTVDLQGKGALNLAIDGSLPVTLLRRKLTEAGIGASGSISIAGNVTGPISRPVYALRATPTNMSLTEFSTGMRLTSVAGQIDVSPSGITLTGLGGAISSGGTVSVDGVVALDEGTTADISARLADARYVDPGLVSATVSADIKVTGPLASPTNGPLIGGAVTIAKADISIPETLPGAVSPVAVRHLNAPRALKDEIARTGGTSGDGAASEAAGPPMRLDVTIAAPGRIFVRGRGLNAELEGGLRLTGTSDAPQAVGGFTLKRGQLDILTRRLAFSRGIATFAGSMTPVLDFLATTTIDNTTITIAVTGSAEDPEISFSSAPEQPQDEVLALLLFGKSMGNLTPTQLAQLAAAIATLTGGSDSGPLAELRKSLGLDAIDLNLDGEDGPSVAVGKYINDNIYLGVEQGAGKDSSRVTVDIDISNSLKLRGEVGADGDSKAGIYFEKEY